jgi:hypothetical protein
MNFVTTFTGSNPHVTFAFATPSKEKAQALHATLVSCGFDAHFAHEGKVAIPRKGPYKGMELPPCGYWQVIVHEGIHR